MPALRPLGTAILAAAAFVTVTMSVAPDHTAAGTPAPAYALCSEEDGSAPGQTFPCYWGGGSNRQGLTYVLVMPVCSLAQVAASDAAHRAGLPDPVQGQCDDLESLVGA